MAFVPAIDADDDVASYISLENQHEQIARLCIGHDDETGAIYSVFVALNARPGSLVDREISFDVVEAYPGDDENWCNDGLQTKRFLVGEHRKTALSCICSLVQALAMRSDAGVFYMMTVTPDLPQKALKKYEEICKAMRAVGFKAGRDSPFRGTQIWIMERAHDGT